MSQDYFALISHIEDRYRVSDWNVDGVPMWPIIRIGARSEIMRTPVEPAGHPIGKSGSARRWGQALRMAASPIVCPLQNFQDWRHEQVRLGPADALILGDGVSADLVDGSWRDRYGEPLLQALEEMGATGILMQPGRQLLPRYRATYSAEWIDSWGRLMAQLIKPRNVHLPDHDEVLKAFEAHGLKPTVLNRSVVERWGMRIACMARLMDHILARTMPRIGMTISYYWDIGYAFNLACRRRGILSVDIQHGAQGGRHDAYNLWQAVPSKGYSVMPAIFWTWSPDDARGVDSWASELHRPWHRAFPGGHPQLGPWLDDSASITREFDARIAAIKHKTAGTFDILVALQDIEGYGAVWENLARVIQNSPPTWRWWLRRHPSPAYNQGAGTRTLTKLQGPSIILDEASEIQLPALLRNVDAVLSLMSSTAVEASFFGHKSIFLTEDARTHFPNIVGAGKADIIPDMESLRQRLTEMAANGAPRKASYIAPDLRNSMQSLLAMAKDYRGMAEQPEKP